jgi:hypothetical protein
MEKKWGILTDERYTNKEKYHEMLSFHFSKENDSYKVFDYNSYDNMRKVFFTQLLACKSKAKG